MYPKIGWFRLKITRNYPGIGLKITRVSGNENLKNTRVFPGRVYPGANPTCKSLLKNQEIRSQE